MTVAPSASSWLRAHRAVVPAGRRVALVAGPGLASGAEEVPQLATRHESVDVLRNAAATCDATLALDGAWLGHVAAHGIFAGLVASVTPVDDTATVGFSLAVHDAVARGASLGEAVLRARERAGDDPVARATAWSFLALGAA